MFDKFKIQELINATSSFFNIPEDMTLMQARDAMLELSADESANHHRLGLLYNHIVNKKLAENAGLKNAREFCLKHLPDLAPASLARYGAVAEGFSEKVARRFGVTCLSALLSYKVAAALELNHEEPGTALIEVPDEHGQPQPKPFGSCSVQDMRNALRHKRKPTSSKPVPAETVALADTYQQAVNQRFPKGVLITVEARNHHGTPVLDIKGVPAAQLSVLLEVLGAPPSLLAPAPVQEPARA